MNTIIALRSFISWVILLIVMSALVAGVKIGVLDVQDAAFFPVAAFTMTLGYVLGLNTISVRRAWGIILLGGFLMAFIESTKLMEPIKIMFWSIPRFELELIRWLFKQENIAINFPDTAIFKIQWIEIITRADTFTSQILDGSITKPSMREFLWDIPLLFLSAWAGWRTGRHNQILLALTPVIGFHAFILNYTGEDSFSLQVAVFALVLLMGINQKWNFKREMTAKSERAIMETYPTIILLSIVLAFIAGVMPSISIQEISQNIERKNQLAKAIGLERERAQAYEASGLPRQHLVGISPKLSKTIVFTVKTGEISPAQTILVKETIPRHYWRWLTYDIYNGQGWSTSPISNNLYSADELLPPTSNETRRVIHLEVEKAFTQDKHLYWTGTLANANQSYQASWRTALQASSTNNDPFQSADMLGAVTEAQIYQADSLIPIVSANQLRASSQVYPPKIRSRYLALPEGTPQRVRDLAAEITINLTNPYDKAKAIESYLRNFPYSLDVAPPPPKRDIADYFLFDLKTGYCDYYATSMIVLARAAGIPARMVIGYANGTYDSINAQYVVLESDAHSWVEIYFTETGWVEFEPTAGQPQISLPNELPRENIASIPETSPIAYTKVGFFPQRKLFPLIVGLVSIILFSCIWFFRIQGLFRPHKTIASIYEYVYYHGKKIYKDAPLNETPSTFANNLINSLGAGYTWLIPARGEVNLLTDLYLQETYSAHPITKNEFTAAIKIWRKLFWRLFSARIIHLLVKNHY